MKSRHNLFVSAGAATLRRMVKDKLIEDRHNLFVSAGAATSHGTTMACMRPAATISLSARVLRHFPSVDRHDRPSRHNLFVSAGAATGQEDFREAA